MWGGFVFIQEKSVIFAAIGGLIVGIIIAILLVPRMIKFGFQMPFYYLAAIYIFYMIGIYGFFMGVPIFNVIPGLFAAYFFARKDMTADTKNTSKVPLYFIYIMLALFCLSSAIIALRDPYTSGNLEGMLNLSFNIEQWHIWLVIIVGGLGLIFIQITGYLLIKKIVDKMIKN